MFELIICANTGHISVTGIIYMYTYEMLTQAKYMIII